MSTTDVTVWSGRMDHWQFLSFISNTISDAPTVILRMDPPSPVSELDRTNVTLFCDVLDGNPTELYSVKWFMDGVLLKQLPLCDDQGEENDLCDIDPTKLLLEHVTKKFHGNYTCQGANEAGWSDYAEEQELQVFCKFNSFTFTISSTSSLFKLLQLKFSIACLEFTDSS